MEQHPPLYLFDCLSCTARQIEQRLDSTGLNRSTARHLSLVLFNVDPNLRLKAIVKSYNIKGSFSQDRYTGCLLQGAARFLSDQLWLSRKLLSECILMPSPDDSFRGSKSLSDREKTILRMIASLATNQDIAEHPATSIHTVKTHIYRIYKKCNINSRIQASLLLTRELD